MPRRLYHHEMYRFRKPEPSYWEATAGETRLAAEELRGSEQCEVAIIGGGYTGLSAAYHLCRDHQVETRVLEAGHIGWGASGRNGGFCTIGGTSLGIDAMIRRYGLEETRDYYRRQVDAVQLVWDIIRDEQIDAQIQGDTELKVACSKKAFEKIRHKTEHFMRPLGLEVDVLSREEFAQQYFDFPDLAGATRLRPTFALHPLRYTLGLAAAAEKHGAHLHPYSEVIGWGNDGANHILTTRGGTVRSRYVVLATNGYTPEHLYPSFLAKTLPVISSIVVTRPLTSDELAAHAWQTESPAITSFDLLNYFRLLPDKRFMWGGRGSSSGSPPGASKNYARLISRLHELFPAWKDVGIDYRWHGLICLTRRLTPAIGRLDDDPSVFFGFGFHGNGLNNATWTGKQLSDWIGRSRIGDRRKPRALPLAMQGMSDSIPLPALRLAYIQARIAMFRFTDWMQS